MAWVMTPNEEMCNVVKFKGKPKLIVIYKHM